MSDLREPVARAMAVIGCGWRETSPGVFAAVIPPSLRDHFRGRAALRVVFDPEVWQQDRRADLAAPGGAFLDGLERALAERSGQPIRVGGVLESDGALGHAWAARVRVTNALLEKLDHPISFHQALRFVFEAEIPLSPPVTELVTVACDLEGNLLTPRDLALRDPVHAYDYDEVSGALPLRIEWPQLLVERLRGRCRSEAERRIRRAFAGELRQRANRGAAQVEEARIAYAREWMEAQNDAERADLEEEFARRRAVYETGASGTICVRERTVTLLVTGKDSLVARYQRRSGTGVDILPKTSLGKIRDDQCAHCPHVRTEYVIAQDRAELWCTTCGRACVATECDGTMRAGTTTCARCSDARWCPDHVSACAACSALRCPDHGGCCTVCRAAGCEEHLRIHSVTKDLLCLLHGQPCAVDGAMLRDSELTACARSGDAVCAEHRVAVDLPAGAIIRADRLRVCAASGVKLDVDFADVCSVDKQVYVGSSLVKCPVTGRCFHPRNGVRPDGDERLLHPDAVVRCNASGRLVARDVAIPDEFASRAPLHPAEAVRCELSSRWTALVRTRVTPCCGKRVAVSLTGISVLSGRRVCRACVRTCVAEHGPFLPDEMGTCDLSGAAWCLAHLVATACGRRVGPDRAIHLEDGTSECVEHFRRCEPGDHTAPASDLLVSILTGRECCPSHRTHCRCHGGIVGGAEYEQDPYDGSAWCPEAMVACAQCGERAPRAPGAEVCRWCAAAAQLDQADPFFAEHYRRRVIPRLTWYTVRLSVQVSGTPTLAWFRVATLTGQLVFRVTPDAVAEWPPRGAPRAR